jgi:hypothetical protein
MKNGTWLYCPFFSEGQYNQVRVLLPVFIQPLEIESKARMINKSILQDQPH